MAYKFSNPYMSKATRASFLQRVILIHSLLYYEFDNPIWDDRRWDEIAQQLVAMTENMTQAEKEKTQYWYAMYDFDGSTGFDIIYRLTEPDRERIMQIIRRKLT